MKSSKPGAYGSKPEGVGTRTQSHTLPPLLTGKINPFQSEDMRALRPGGCAWRGGTHNRRPQAPWQCPRFIRACPASTFPPPPNHFVPHFQITWALGVSAADKGPADFLGMRMTQHLCGAFPAPSLAVSSTILRPLLKEKTLGLLIWRLVSDGSE